MRFSRCLIRLSDISGGEGIITLPNGVFDRIDPKQLFVATRRTDSNVISLHPIGNSDAIIYEVYCELDIDKIMSMFIMELKNISMELDGISLLSITDGVCRGDPKSPCTFDGFIMIDHGGEDQLSIFKEKVKDMTINDKKIVKTVEVYRV